MQSHFWPVSGGYNNDNQIYHHSNFAPRLNRGAVAGYKFIKYIKGQSRRINDLYAQVALLNLKIDLKNDVVKWGEGFNYLAIGNSITKHKINEYWWNEAGMAATTVEKDYFHRVCSYLKAEHGALVSYAYNGAIWAVQTNDRSQVLNYWDEYLSVKLDLVTIQVSKMHQI